MKSVPGEPPLSLRLAAIIACSVLPIAAQQYSFEHYGQEQGLASSMVRTLAQDREGFLWVGTGHGLYRYDGTRFQLFGQKDGLPEDRIRALHIGPDGTLWVGTERGLAKRVGKRFVNVAQDLIVRTRTSIASDANGNLYIATAVGLFASNTDGKFARVSEGGDLSSSRVDGVFVDRNHVVWYGCGQWICRWSEGKWRKFSEREGVAKGSWGGFQNASDGSLLARDGAHLLRLKQGADRFEPDSQFHGEGTDQMVLDAKGKIVAPSSSGIWISGGKGEWRRIAQDQGLPADRVNCVLEDREGALWVGFADFGLARWRGRDEWEGWNRGSGLTHDEVSAIARTQDGAVWAGTRRGLNRLDPRTGLWRHFHQADGLAAEDVRSLAVTPDGKLWIASTRNGLAWLDPKSLRITRVAESSGLAARAHLSLYVDNSGKLWVPCREGLYIATQTAPPKFTLALPGVLLPKEEIYAVRQDARGRFWMAGNRGLLREENGQWKRLGEKDGLRSDLVVLLTIARDGGVWVGYGPHLGAGRVAWNGGRIEIRHFDQDNVLASSEMSFLGTGPRGWIWAGTDNGIDVFDGSLWRHISTYDGLIWHDTVFNAFLAEQDGGVWIGTNRGLSHFRPSGAMFQAQPPSVVVTEVRIGGRPAEFGGPLQVSYRNRAIQLGFQTLTFSRRHATQFRYQLKGLDHNWIETREREVVFSNLAPGKYEFEVQAGTAGAWNPHSATVAFEVLPAWWQSWWIQAGLVLIASFSGGELYRRRMRRIRRLQDELESAVEQRTRELQLEKQTVEQHQKDIEKLLEDAQQANRLKSEFLANVSHEIRTPMNGILGMTALVLQTPLQPDQRECLEVAKSSGQALLGLLNDILDFSKIEANRLEIEALPFSLTACVEDSIRTLSVHAQEKGLRLEMKCDPAVPQSLIGDPARLRQVFLNLLSNGIKFTDRGAVRLEVEAESRQGSTVLLRFAVQDSGAGIPVDKQKVIFEAFRQADGSTTRKYGGTGLGLAISSRLVEMMGGRIWVNSAPGEGSRFSFTARFQLASTLPQGVPDSSNAHEIGKLASALEGRTIRPMRILVAEDNVVNQKLVVRLLEKQGHEVEVASDGRQALQLSSHKHFDVIFMDVQMPEIDGLETTRLIREREKQIGGHTPILMLTASAMAGDREKCLDAGADGYMAKPVSMERLLSALDEVSAMHFG